MARFRFNATNSQAYPRQIPFTIGVWLSVPLMYQGKTHHFALRLLFDKNYSSLSGGRYPIPGGEYYC